MMSETPMRVLVVDDEISVRMSLAIYLEEMGYEVFSSGTAAEALGGLTREPVDVAIVNLSLPDMDGQTFIAKAHRLCSATRFLIHTGAPPLELPDSLVRLGITTDDIIPKPAFDLDVITRALERLVAD